MRRLPLLISATVAFAALAGVGLGLRLARQTTPGESSADVGFARDMAVHHAQAVEMAEIIRGRTSDETLRILATDIVLTQQAQIGQMQGWLAAWGRPNSGAALPMAWMGDPTSGPMPGMAARADIAELASAPVGEAERSFLRLMILHHRGGIDMAEAARRLVHRPEVQRLAQAIAASQSTEIGTLTEALAARGEQPPAPPAPPAPDGPGHDGQHPGG